jgi:hypothetical protein
LRRNSWGGSAGNNRTLGRLDDQVNGVIWRSFCLRRFDRSCERRGVLYRFEGGRDGAYLMASLVIDAHGVLCGTTSGAEAAMARSSPWPPPAAGQSRWVETVLHRFHAAPLGDGGQPQAALIMDKDGIFYGTMWCAAPKRRGNSGGAERWTRQAPISSSLKALASTATAASFTE